MPHPKTVSKLKAEQVTNELLKISCAPLLSAFCCIFLAHLSFSDLKERMESVCSTRETEISKDGSMVPGTIIIAY